MPSDDIQRLLKNLFDAERAVRAAQATLLDQERGALTEASRAAIDEAVALSDRGASNLRRVRVAELLGDVEGRRPSICSSASSARRIGAAPRRR